MFAFRLLSEFFQVPKLKIFTSESFCIGRKLYTTTRTSLCSVLRSSKFRSPIFFHVSYIFPHVSSYFPRIPSYFPRIFLHIFRMFLHIFHIFSHIPCKEKNNKTAPIKGDSQILARGAGRDKIHDICPNSEPPPLSDSYCMAISLCIGSGTWKISEPFLRI